MLLLNVEEKLNEVLNSFYSFYIMKSFIRNKFV